MANQLVYRTHDLESLGRQVEEVVRADLSAAMRVPYRIVAGSAERLTAKTFGSDIMGLMVGMRPATVGFIEFDLPWHRRAMLTVTMERVGVTSVVGSLDYAIELAKPVIDVAEFELPKLFRPGRFTGGEAAARLNGSASIGKRLGKVVQAEALTGTITLRVAAAARIVPATESTSELIVLTLPKIGLRSATTHAGELVAISRDLEAAL